MIELPANSPRPRFSARLVDPTGKFYWDVYATGSDVAAYRVVQWPAAAVALDGRAAYVLDLADQDAALRDFDTLGDALTMAAALVVGVEPILS